MVSALSHLKILELSRGVSGEYCGKLLSDFGAEVIKLESPEGGSPTRRLAPFSASVDGPESSGLFAYLNTNKRSVAFAIDSEAGAATLQRLLASVDVVISDHADGWLQSLGIDAETCDERYPGLVICSITPYGHSEAGDSEAAEDLNVFHSSGWGYHTPSDADVSRPPLKGPGRFLASYESGLEAAMCVVAALCEREASRQGQYIDISMQAVLASRIDYVLGQMIAGELPVGEDRRAFDLAGPAGIFPCRDGFVYIWMSAPGHWQALHKLLGEPEWMAEFPEHWLERECTPDRVATVRQHLVAWLQGQDKHEVAEAAQKLGLILVPVNNPEDLQASPQYQFRGFFQTLEHPLLGAVSYPTVPYRMAGTPATLTSAAPLLGQHTQETLATLGVDSRGGEQ